jgi:hypothetical protein
VGNCNPRGPSDFCIFPLFSSGYAAAPGGGKLDRLHFLHFYLKATERFLHSSHIGLALAASPLAPSLRPRDNPKATSYREHQPANPAKPRKDTR